MDSATLEGCSEPALLPTEEDYGPHLNRTIWILTTLSALFLGLRLYCKHWRCRSLWWDDYVLVLSWVALAVSASLQSVCVSLGLGKANGDILPDNFTLVVIYSYAAGFVSVLATVWSKTSFAMTLLRISNGWVKKFVWFIIITVNIVLGLNATFQWIQCWPVQRLWDINVEGSCWTSSMVQQYNTFTSAYSGAMDIVLALLPWKIIWNVAINKKEKVGVLFAMSMGVFAGITSLLKIATLSAIGKPEISPTVDLFIFGTAEGAITIIAASIPILRALIQREGQPPPARFVQLHEGRWVTSQRLRETKKDIVGWQGDTDTDMEVALGRSRFWRRNPAAS